MYILLSLSRDYIGVKLIFAWASEVVFRLESLTWAVPKQFSAACLLLHRATSCSILKNMQAQKVTMDVAPMQVS